MYRTQLRNSLEPSDLLKNNMFSHKITTFIIDKSCFKQVKIMFSLIVLLYIPLFDNLAQIVLVLN